MEGTTAKLNRSRGHLAEEPPRKSDSEYFDNYVEESQEFHQNYGKARVPDHKPLENREKYLLNTDVGKTIRFVDRVIEYKNDKDTE